MADNTWSYHQESDSLTNQTYSFAQSPLPRPGLYDNIMLEIVCKENKLQAVIDADDLIASQNSSFDLEYQIDKKSPVPVPMKTFPDSKRKGYTIEFAKRIADDMLTGQAIFIRVNTMIRTVLSVQFHWIMQQNPLNMYLLIAALAYQIANPSTAWLNLRRNLVSFLQNNNSKYCLKSNK